MSVPPQSVEGAHRELWRLASEEGLHALLRVVLSRPDEWRAALGWLHGHVGVEGTCPRCGMTTAEMWGGHPLCRGSVAGFPSPTTVFMAVVQPMREVPTIRVIPTTDVVLVKDACLRTQVPTYVDLLAASKIRPSRSECRRLIEGGGVSLGAERLTGDGPVPLASVEAGVIELKIGKHGLRRFVFTEEGEDACLRTQVPE